LFGLSRAGIRSATVESAVVVAPGVDAMAWLARFFFLVSQLTNSVSPFDWRRIGGLFTMARCVITPRIGDLTRVFHVLSTVERRDSNGAPLGFMPPVLAVPVAVVAIKAAIITVRLRAPHGRCPDPGVVTVVSMFPLSVALRLVLFPVSVMFFIWTIVWRTHGDIVTQVAPHRTGQFPCANPAIVLVVDVDMRVGIIIGADRRIVPVVVRHHAR